MGLLTIYHKILLIRSQEMSYSGKQFLALQNKQFAVSDIFILNRSLVCNVFL